MGLSFIARLISIRLGISAARIEIVVGVIVGKFTITAVSTDYK